MSIWIFTSAFSKYLAMQLLYCLNFLKKKTSVVKTVVFNTNLSCYNGMNPVLINQYV